MSRETCPCCGQPVPGAIDDWAIAADLTPMQARTLRAIADRRGEWITAMQIAAVIYADRADGGPEFAGKIVSAFVCAVRKKMRQMPAPFAIEARPGAGYRILRVERNAA